MTSVLYSAGLNYQAGNPVRQEFASVRREAVSLRKQLETLTEQNLILQKHLMKLLSATEDGSSEFSKDMLLLSSQDVAVTSMQSNLSMNNSGMNGNNQGNRFRR